MKAKIKNKNLHKRVLITNEIREALKAKREKLHYSYNDVAELLGVNLSTYRLWEKQLTTHYTRFVEQRVIAYLNDDLQKKKEHLQNRVPITDEICEALKAKREKLHYSYNDVADLLGVHWSTYRKWELQSTTHYSGLMEQKVIAYLNDDLHEQAQIKKEHLHNRVPITDEIRKALKAKREKMHYTYNDVAERLGVHFTTYRLWEKQSTTHYTKLMEQRVIAYLNDDLHEQANVADMADLERLVNRQKSVFRLLSNDLKMQMKFFSDMEKLLDETLDKYSIIHQNNAEEE